MASSKSLVVYSDIHCGSKRAICPRDTSIPDYRPNKFQKLLNDIRDETIDELLQKPRFKVINGEPFDGGNPKQNGRGQNSTNMAYQLLDAENLLKRIPGQEFVFVQGSGYHVDKEGTSFEEILAEKMKGRKYSTYYEPTFAEDFAQFKLNGIIFNITHHIVCARWAAYRTTAIASEMAALHFMK